MRMESPHPGRNVACLVASIVHFTPHGRPGVRSPVAFETHTHEATNELEMDRYPVRQYMYHTSCVRTRAHGQDILRVIR